MFILIWYWNDYQNMAYNPKIVNIHIINLINSKSKSSLQLSKLIVKRNYLLKLIKIPKKFAIILHM